MKISAPRSEALTRVAAELARAVQGDLLRDVPMSRHTSFQVGGPADLFLQPASERDLVLAVTLARGDGVPVTLVGRGSNLLVDDLGIRGLTVKAGKGTDTIHSNGERLTAGAGASLGQLATAASRAGLSGMEFGILVPGNLGGGVFMNAGARGQEMRGVVSEVRVLETGGEVREIPASECGFGYRQSRFQESDEIILGAVLLLARGERAEIEATMAGIQENRKRTMPVGHPSGGATFKRPPGDYAGRLIESAGCKGWREGGVQVSTLHANYFINDQGATAAEVRELIARVHDRVLEFHGVKLEKEVVFAGGESGWDLPYAGRGTSVNILLLNYSLRPQGGSQMTSVSTAEALARRGHQVVYGAEAGPLVERLRRGGIGFIDLPTNPRHPQMQNLSAANVAALAGALRQHRIDIIHCFQYFLTVAVSISRLVRPAPLFVTLLGPRLPSHRQPPGIAQLFAVSEELRDVAVREEYERGDRITILPHRIDFSRYGEPRGGEDLARRLGLTEPRQTVVMLSTFEPGKVGAIRTFVAAAERLRSRHPAARFVIGGDGPHLEEIRREAERVNGGVQPPALTLPGILDVPEALDLADVVVGMGRSALEGMAAGKPTVVVGTGRFVAIADRSHVPLLRYTNFTGRGGEVAADPAAELAAALDQLLTAPAKAAAVGEFGRRFVREHYDIAHAVTILEAAYEDALRTAKRLRRSRLTSALIGFTVRSMAVSSARRMRLALEPRIAGSGAASPEIPHA